MSAEKNQRKVEAVILAPRPSPLTPHDTPHPSPLTPRPQVEAEEQLRLASRSIADLAAQRLQSYALELVVPTFIATLGFVWNATFGFMLCASGLLRGVAIGAILGLPDCHSRRKYVRVAVPLALSAVITVATVRPHGLELLRAP